MPTWQMLAHIGFHPPNRVVTALEFEEHIVFAVVLYYMISRGGLTVWIDNQSFRPSPRPSGFAQLLRYRRDLHSLEADRLRCEAVPGQYID